MRAGAVKWNFMGEEHYQVLQKCQKTQRLKSIRFGNEGSVRDGDSPLIGLLIMICDFTSPDWYFDNNLQLTYVSKCAQGASGLRGSPAFPVGNCKICIYFKRENGTFLPGNSLRSLVVL